MLDHYQETYRVTHRFEYERNRLFVLFILVLIVAIYLALNKEVAQVALDFFAPKSDAAQKQTHLFDSMFLLLEQRRLVFRAGIVVTGVGGGQRLFQEIGQGSGDQDVVHGRGPFRVCGNG